MCKNFLHINARNIKGENSGQKPKMVYTPSATAQSEMTENIVSIKQSHHQQSPQAADLEAISTCHFSRAINMFS